MKKLRSYSKSEDAHLAAALLGSSGIEAVVVDDNAMGGNFSGIQKNAIRVEVEEKDFEKAVVILEEAITQDGESTPETVTDSAGVSILFNALVIAELAFYGMRWLFPDPFSVDPGPEANRALEEEIARSHLLFIAYQMAWGVFILGVLSSLLLYARLKLGRILYTGTILYGVMSCFVFPPVVPTQLGEAATALGGLMSGAVLILMWVPPLAGEFRKRLSLR